MADAKTSPPAAPAAPATPTKSKAEVKAEAKAAREAAKVSANGVTRPKGGTQTGRIWEISDALSTELKAPVGRKAVIESALKEGLNEATAATQYGRWRKFHGLKAEPKPVSAPAAAAGSDVSTQAAPSA